MVNLQFDPDFARARALDLRMQKQLAHSFQHICDACYGKINFNENIMHEIIQGLKQGKVAKPSTFAKYYKLVLSIEEENFEETCAVFEEICASPFMDSSLEIIKLGDPKLGCDNQLYMEMMNTDDAIGFKYPSDDIAENFEIRLNSGFKLLDATLPNLAAEIRSIIRQIVIAGSDPSKKYQFDGGSHYQIWGALFLNGAYHPNDIAVAEVLAHETAHSLLFGFCVDEPLVLNDDEELFSSPLRADLRPMDGIYHATFVSARMHWAMSQMARSDVLTKEQKAHAIDAAEQDAKNFNAGYTVVKEHGRLTDTGKGLMEAAKSYMEYVN